MDRYISGVDMITGLGVMDKDTDKRHVGWYKADEVDKEIERLRRAFEKYGSHIPIIEDGSYKGICEYLKHSKNTCNCGFKKMQQALKEE